jgi:hypothetical protein
MTVGSSSRPSSRHSRLDATGVHPNGHGQDSKRSGCRGPCVETETRFRPALVAAQHSCIRRSAAGGSLWQRDGLQRISRNSLTAMTRSMRLPSQWQRKCLPWTGSETARVRTAAMHSPPARRAWSTPARGERFHRQVPDELSRFRIRQPIAREQGHVAVHLERRCRGGVCVLAAFLQSPVQVRGDRRKGALTLIFTAVPGLRKAPVSGGRGDVIEAMCRLRHAYGWLAVRAGMPLSMALAESA